MDANRANQKLPANVDGDDLRVHTRSDRHAGEWVIEWDERLIFSSSDLYEVMDWLRRFRAFRTPKEL